jgi:copper resistance protein B
VSAAIYARVKIAFSSTKMMTGETRMSNLRHLWLVALVVLVLAGLVIEASGDQISLSGNVSRLEYRQSRRAYQSRVVQAEGEAALGNDVWKIEGRIKSKFADEESGWRSFEIQALLAKAISESWTVYGGVRQDVDPAPTWTSAVGGLSGQFLDAIQMDLGLFVFETGGVTARVEAAVDSEITPRIFLQPALDIDVAILGSEDSGTETGIIVTDIGLRLIYKVTPLISSYAGVAFERNWGDTRRNAEILGQELENIYFLLGLQLSY